jgi:hypothetical protein
VHVYIYSIASIVLNGEEKWRKEGGGTAEEAKSINNWPRKKLLLFPLRQRPVVTSLELRVLCVCVFARKEMYRTQIQNIHTYKLVSKMKLYSVFFFL